MVTIFYLLARLLYWSRSSREVIFTMQGSRTACITQKKRTHKSGCPVSIFFRHIIYVSPWVTPPLMLPSRPSLPKAWPTIPPHFEPDFIIQDIYQDIYVPLGAPSFWSCGRSDARCLFHEYKWPRLNVMHHALLPFI